MALGLTMLHKSISCQNIFINGRVDVRISFILSNPSMYENELEHSF